MAKQPITQDRFRIHAETSLEQMGSVLAELTRLGLTNVGYELITDVKAWGRKAYDTTVVDAVAEWIKEHPTFHIGEMIADTGRARDAIYKAVKGMVGKKLLTKLGAGNYQSADVKAIAPPKAAPVAEKKARPANTVAHYDISNKDLIWRHIKGRTRFKLAELRVLFRANNRPENSASPLMTKMAGEKLIKLVGPGEYLVLKKAIKARAKKAASKPKRLTSPAELNGAASTSGITTNG